MSVRRRGFFVDAPVVVAKVRRGGTSRDVGESTEITRPTDDESSAQRITRRSVKVLVILRECLFTILQGFSFAKSLLPLNIFQHRIKCSLGYEVFALLTWKISQNRMEIFILPLELCYS